jgi:prevent-host-death family protein
MARSFNVTEARANLSKLLKRVQHGEEIVIAKASKPVARLVPFIERPARRKPGLFKGRIWISDDFDDPLPPELQKHFE